MKPLVFLWMLFAGVSAFAAGEPTINYKIIITPSGTSSGEYSCSLKALQSTLFWQKNDLITWIFPDGQYLKSEEPVGGGAEISRAVTWKPFSKPAVADSIIVYVARKGKPGNPARIAGPADGLINVITPATPNLFNLLEGGKWNLSESWSCSPKCDNILILTYDPTDCIGSDISGTFSISFDPNKIEFLTQEKLFYSEIPNSNNPGEYKILLPNTQFFRHAFIKIKVKPTVKVGDVIDFSFKGNICNPDTVLSFSYLVAADPHDPNWKIVDIDTIDANGPSKRLIYTIQYHNDGTAPVNKIDIYDRLPPQVDPSTVTFINQHPNCSWEFITEDQLAIHFDNMNLPGLNQTNPSYGYDQTIFRFSFQVYTKPNVNTTFPNNATITFYDSAGDPMMPIITDPATVYTQSPQQECPRCCCGLFCWIRKWCHRRK